MSIIKKLLAILLLVSGINTTAYTREQPIIIGSKKFTENVILGEIANQLVRHSGTVSVHRREFGGTRVLWNGLLSDEIDIYPEYTGTIIHEILSGQSIKDVDHLRKVLGRYGISATQMLGFNNTYVLGMLESTAGRLGITRISDLANHPQLRLGFSNEFMDRGDGWPGLKNHYRLPQQQVNGLDHDLAYRGLESGSLDVIDLYSTDANISYYKIRQLIDDRQYFPDYFAVYLYRAGLEKKFPRAVSALQHMEGKIDNAAMVRMNAAVKLQHEPEIKVAAGFINETLDIKADFREATIVDRFIINTRDHLVLIVISLTAAIICAIPLGILSARRHRLGQFILAVAGILQTIPSLALFVFMIPLLGIGGPPAVMALFLYSLLPIIRNTYSGLHDISAPVLESAVAIGLPSMARLRLIELPLAARSILSGIKTSAVINVGTATLGALIGAGGYGQPILTGIRLDNTGLILEGAIPAAVLALLVQGVFELIERILLPESLRYSAVI